MTPAWIKIGSFRDSPDSSIYVTRTSLFPSSGTPEALNTALIPRGFTDHTPRSWVWEVKHRHKIFHNIPYANPVFLTEGIWLAFPAGSASSKTRLALGHKRRQAFLVILGQARQRKLIDVHMAGEVVQRVRQPINSELRHRNR